MLIHGKSKSLLKRGDSIPKACPQCNGIHTLQMQVYAVYHHVYFIPYWPSFKYGVLECQQCHAHWHQHQLPYPDMEVPLQELCSNTRYKFRYYSGLVLFLAFASAVAYSIFDSETTRSEEKKKHLSAIESKDVLQVKLSKDKYTTWRVSRVSGDTVFIYENKIGTNLKKELSRIDESNNYAKKETWFFRYEIDDFIKEEKIFDNDKSAHYYE